MLNKIKILLSASLLCLSLGLDAATATPPTQGIPQLSEEAKLEQNIQYSQAETEAWLALIDKKQYGESWDRASFTFRHTINREDWIKAMQKIRDPMGNLISRSNLDIRTAKDPKGLPAGDYMVFFYKTAFGNQKEGHELVTLVQENDGHWKVLTYQAN